MFERVRDECGDYLKSLEAKMLEEDCVDLTKRIELDAETETDSVSLRIQDTFSVNSKRALDNDFRSPEQVRRGGKAANMGLASYVVGRSGSNQSSKTNKTCSAALGKDKTWNSSNKRETKDSV